MVDNRKDEKFHGIKLYNFEDRNIEENEQWYGTDMEELQNKDVRYKEAQKRKVRDR